VEHKVPKKQEQNSKMNMQAHIHFFLPRKKHKSREHAITPHPTRSHANGHTSAEKQKKTKKKESPSIDR
jgi:hypothetical protein